MKRFAMLTVMLVLALALGVSAQETAAKKMAFGIQAGLGFGNASGDSAKADPGETKKMRMGILGGAFAEFKLGTQFALRPELMYVQKGVKYEFDGGGKMTVKADYLELPVLFAWAPEMQGKTQASVFAGPYAAMLMSAKIKGEGFTGADSIYNTEEDVKDSTKSIDFGLTFGAGFGYKVSPKGELFFNVRYDLGMTKIDDHAEQADTKSNLFAVVIGYKFK